MEIEIPRILFLALDVCYKCKSNVFNTNTLTQAINTFTSERVRSRADKTDYKMGDDTNYGGMRGNLSTLLTWKGFVQRGKHIISSYSIGMDNRIINAFAKGEISLHYRNETCVTSKQTIANLLRRETKLRDIREQQAHIKKFLEVNPQITLSRDIIKFPKESVVISPNNQMFLRSLVNNFVDTKGKILQYCLTNFWEGKKIKQFNIHPLIVIPNKKSSWGKIYALQFEDIFSNMPLLLNVNLENLHCSDTSGNTYQLYLLDDALKIFSDRDANIEKRSTYSWKNLKERYCNHEVSDLHKREDEFSEFLRKYLKWKCTFNILGKKVVDMKTISSGGPDVELIFSGGTKQLLELEHMWINYIQHKHHLNSSFSSCWLFADEPFDFNKIKKIFKPFIVEYSHNMPSVFLSCNDDVKKAFKINWNDESFTEIPVTD